MVLKNSKGTINGSGRRRLDSWINAFVNHAEEEAESCELYRRWCAITAIAACLEQKVWLNSPAPLYPNLYTLLVGPPAVGKSRTISVARNLLGTLTDFPFAPTSVTMAALVDSLKECERKYTLVPGPTVFYNSMTLVPDDLQVLMSTYDLSLIAGLTTFYDVNHPYREQRRTGDLRVEIKRPQLSILGGTTPSHLFGFIPEEAWSQGFTSRLLLVYSDEKIKKRVRFNSVAQRKPDDLIHDLKLINSLIGEFHVDEKAEKAFNNWIDAGEPPAPTHKRLEHYLGRRYPHLLKLSMVSSVDRSNGLVITVEDFNRALGWLVEVEHAMPRIFAEGPRTIESKVMDEVAYYIKQLDIAGAGIAESKIKNFVLQRVSPMQYKVFFEALEIGGFIKRAGHDKLTKEPRWMALDRDLI